MAASPRTTMIASITVAEYATEDTSSIKVARTTGHAGSAPVLAKNARTTLSAQFANQGFT